MITTYIEELETERDVIGTHVFLQFVTSKLDTQLTNGQKLMNLLRTTNAACLIQP